MQPIITLYQKRLLIELRGKGYIQCHRSNANSWQRRKTLLAMAERGIIKLSLPVMGSYYTFHPKEGVDMAAIL